MKWPGSKAIMCLILISSTENMAAIRIIVLKWTLLQVQQRERER